MEAEVHEAVTPIAFLLGKWRGTGTGEYPTIDNFSYEEETEFWHSGRPWVGYVQKTRSRATGMPMHSESGYLRPKRDGSIEAVIAHAFGGVEVLEGRIEGDEIHMKSTNYSITSTAKQVDAVERTLRKDGDGLTYDIAMAFGGHPMTAHLTATLERHG
jgi:hypothetical protein